MVLLLPTPNFNKGCRGWLIDADSTSGYFLCMSDTAIPVADAARDFLRVLDLVERKRETAVLIRDGKPVATINPIPEPAQNCRQLAERWSKLDRLPAEEARAFAEDLERSRANLPGHKPAWD